MLCMFPFTGLHLNSESESEFSAALFGRLSGFVKHVSHTQLCSIDFHKVDMTLRL